MGLGGDRNYARYHHVLDRSAWSPLQGLQVLLSLLLQHLDQGDGPLISGIAFLPHRFRCCSDKDDAVALFLPPGFSCTTSWDSTVCSLDHPNALD